MDDKAELGSKTAKGGFANEKAICEKFNNWKNDIEAQHWLLIMGYDIRKLDAVNAIQVPTKIKKEDTQKYSITQEDYEEFINFKKADAQIRITIRIGDITKIENLSLKKANSNADYNQLDKRTVESYQKIWGFDNEICLWLKLFTGEIIPTTRKELIGNIKPKDERRLFLTEIPKYIQCKIINFFSSNKILVVSDIIKGRGGLSANWMLVTKFNGETETTTWILKEINTVMNFYGCGDVIISPRGSLHIGSITAQRKGGTPDPTKLQFKFNPCELFQVDKNNGNG